jgi:hypothetical protein
MQRTRTVTGADLDALTVSDPSDRFCSATWATKKTANATLLMEKCTLVKSRAGQLPRQPINTIHRWRVVAFLLAPPRNGPETRSILMSDAQKNTIDVAVF